MRLLAENKGIAFYLFVFLFCIYIFTAQGNNIDTSDQQQVRFATTHSIIEDGDLSIPDGMGVKGNYGEDYSWYGIGQPILSIPFYLVGRFMGGYDGAQWMVSLLNLVVVAVSGVVVFLFISNLGYSKKTALTIALFYALGTLAWPQSKHPFDHPVEMLFVLIAVFYAYLFTKDGKNRYLLISSLSLGFAFLTRPPAVLSLLPIFVLICYTRLERGINRAEIFAAVRDCAVYSLAFAPFVFIQLWYNYARFGSIFETGINLMAKRAGIDFFTGTPLITGLSGFLISPGKGFFYYSPIAILLFFSIKGFYKRHRGLTLCIIGIVFSYLIFLSRNIAWHGDWCWGPRYLLAITPLLMILISDLVEKLFISKKLILRYAIFLIFGISICVQLIGVSVDWNRYFFSLQIEEGVSFTRIRGDGIPILFESNGIQFDWDKFPIVYQAGSAFKIAKGLNNYRYIDEPGKTYDVEEALRYYIRFNVFDFWWFYALYTGTPPYVVVPMLLILFFVMVLSLYRIRMLIRK